MEATLESTELLDETAAAKDVIEPQAAGSGAPWKGFSMPFSLPINLVRPWAQNPRKAFDGEALERLTESVRKYGVLQNIVVRMVESGADDPIDAPAYEIVSGERRYRAAVAAGLSHIPARNAGVVGDFEALEMAFRENHDRDNLTDLEESRSYQAMLDLSRGLTQSALAERLNIAQGTVSNALRILRLPDYILEALEAKQISKGTAIALCGLIDNDRLKVVFTSASVGGWPQSRVEAEVKAIKDEEKAKQAEAAAQPQLPLASPDTEEDPQKVEPEIASPVVEDSSEGYTTAPVPAWTMTQQETENLAGDVEAAPAADTAVSPGQTPQAASASYPLPSADVIPGGKSVGPTAATAPSATGKPDALTAPIAPAHSAASSTGQTPTAPAPVAPLAQPAMLKPKPGYMWVEMKISDDDWLFDGPGIDLDAAMEELRTYRLTDLAKKAVKALTDDFQARFPEQEPFATPSLAIQSLLLIQAGMRKIDVETLQEIPL